MRRADGRRILVHAACAAALVWLAVAAAADTVYLNDGRVYTGKVRREGGKVYIQTALATIAVDAGDVEKIVVSPPDTGPATAGAPAPPPGPGPDTAGRVGTERFTRPESVVFMLMRQLAATPSGLGSYQLREDIKRWQMSVHDRLRRVDGRWVSPRDSILARQQFLELLKAAQPTVAELRRMSYATATGRAERAAKLRALSAELQRAAQVWPDGPLRDFLMGAACLEGDLHAAAAGHFQNARRAAPLVAAFWQGEALALAGSQQYLEALAADLEVLKLRPNSAEALELVYQGIRDVPGAKMNDPVFRAAKLAVAPYEEPKARTYIRRGTTWLMPGRELTAQEYSLPTPPYDRLVFRQAVGAPVARNVLLVDEDAVRDALDVFVFIDARTVVPGTVRRGFAPSRTRAKVPVELVAVEDVEFAPLSADPRAARAADGQVASIHAAPLLTEMGGEIRTFSAAVEKAQADGTFGLSQPLAPGESAAPIISDGGGLLGFVAARTDPLGDGGGEHRIIPLRDLADLLKRTGGATTSYAGYRRAVRKLTPKAVQGRAFLVVAVAGEMPDAPR